MGAKRPKSKSLYEFTTNKNKFFTNWNFNAGAASKNYSLFQRSKSVAYQIPFNRTVVAISSSPS